MVEPGNVSSIVMCEPNEFCHILRTVTMLNSTENDGSCKEEKTLFLNFNFEPYFTILIISSDNRNEHNKGLQAILGFR